jgi:predicted PurR-regulated permease PerM
MKRKGQVSIFITFLIISIIIIVLAGLVAPMGVRFNTEMLLAGERILNDSQPRIDDIQDAEVRAAVMNISDAAIDAGANNINVNNQIFQYSGIIMILLAGLVVFLFTRRLVEFGAGGFI